jgi:hypothetical protein
LSGARKVSCYEMVISQRLDNPLLRGNRMLYAY